MAVRTDPLSPPEQSMAVPKDPIWRLSVAQYHQMIESGILTEDDPVELLEGWLVAKMPKKPHHSLATQLTHDMLVQLLPSGWFTNVQEPVTMSDSEPEPDIVIVRGERRHYSDRHPAPEDIALLVEVADATLRRDQTLKRKLYAEAGIVIYWILNLPDRQLEVYTEPFESEGQTDYKQRTIYQSSDNVPVILEGQEVAQLAVNEILP